MGDLSNVGDDCTGSRSATHVAVLPSDILPTSSEAAVVSLQDFGEAASSLASMSCTSRSAQMIAEGWTLINDSLNCQVWKRGCGREFEQDGKKSFDIFEYMAMGVMPDISVADFHRSLNDPEVRKSWDTSIAELHRISSPVPDGKEREHEGVNEEWEWMYWRFSLPWPLKDRDYVYRRAFASLTTAFGPAFVSIQKSSPHPLYPEKASAIRITQFESRCALFSHPSPFSPWTKDGMQYVMHHCDNPRVALPQWFVNTVTAQALPNSIKMLHTNALTMKQQNPAPAPLPPTLPSIRHSMSARSTESPFAHEASRRISSRKMSADSACASERDGTRESRSESIRSSYTSSISGRGRVARRSTFPSAEIFRASSRKVECAPTDPQRRRQFFPNFLKILFSPLARGSRDKAVDPSSPSHADAMHSTSHSPRSSRMRDNSAPPVSHPRPPLYGSSKTRKNDDASTPPSPLRFIWRGRTS